MTSLLIVNDDGAQSPILRPLAQRLAEVGGVGEVRVAVPLEENSWKAKAMTRYGVLRVERLEGFPGEAFAVGGTPSDAANLGVHHLFAGPPDWVVSGINIGINAGMNFILNSGTVGAAFEAALTGVPAVAFSVHLPHAIYGQWAERRELAGEEAERMIAATTERAARMMSVLCREGMPPEAMVLNVNFPQRLEPDTPVRWVPLLENRYGSLFTPDGEGFVHAYQGDTWRGAGPADKTVVEQGEISVTALSLRGLSAPVRDPLPL